MIMWQKYLKIFNNQIPSEQAAADVKDAVAKSIEKNSNLTEDDALLQARVAHILQDGDYEKGKVKLWTPQNLHS